MVQATMDRATVDQVIRDQAVIEQTTMNQAPLVLFRCSRRILAEAKVRVVLADDREWEAWDTHMRAITMERLYMEVLP